MHQKMCSLWTCWDHEGIELSDEDEVTRCIKEKAVRDDEQEGHILFTC